jgi:hypothetical protein
MARCNCIRTATWAEESALNRTERELKAYDRQHGTHRAPDWRDEQARLFRETQRRCRRQHGGGWW